MFVCFTDLVRLSFGVVTVGMQMALCDSDYPRRFVRSLWVLNWSAFHSSQHHLSLKLWNRVEEIMRYDKTKINNDCGEETVLVSPNPGGQMEINGGDLM